MDCDAVGYYYPEWETALIFKKCTDWMGMTTIAYIKNTSGGTPLPPFPAAVKGKVNDEDLKDFLLDEAGLDSGDAYAWPQDDISQDYLDDVDKYEVPQEVADSIDGFTITDGGEDQFEDPI